MGERPSQMVCYQGSSITFYLCPSIAQLEERETVIGYLGHLKVTGSIPVRRILFAAEEIEGAERAGCIEHGASRESGEDELGGRRRGCLCSAQSVSSTPLSSQLLQLLALR